MHEIRKHNQSIILPWHLILLVTCSLSMSLSAAADCTFQEVDHSEVCASDPNGGQQCWETTWWAWVCSTSGGDTNEGSGDPCDILDCWSPEPPPGTVGPPEPPAPPPPQCEVCQTVCWDQYFEAISNPSESWLPLNRCGILCRQLASAERDACLDKCITDFTDCRS